VGATDHDALDGGLECPVLGGVVNYQVHQLILVSQKKKIIKKSCAVTITLDGGSKSVYGRGTF